MKNGTNRGVLVTDLFAGDGPFARVAEDFVLGRCSFCGSAAADDAGFREPGYLCGACAALPLS